MSALILSFFFFFVNVKCLRVRKVIQQQQRQNHYQHFAERPSKSPLAPPSFQLNAFLFLRGGGYYLDDSFSDGLITVLSHLSPDSHIKLLLLVLCCFVCFLKSSDQSTENIQQTPVSIYSCVTVGISVENRVISLGKKKGNPTSLFLYSRDDFHSSGVLTFQTIFWTLQGNTLLSNLIFILDVFVIIS